MSFCIWPLAYFCGRWKGRKGLLQAASQRIAAGRGVVDCLLASAHTECVVWIQKNSFNGKLEMTFQLFGISEQLKGI